MSVLVYLLVVLLLSYAFGYSLLSSAKREKEMPLLSTIVGYAVSQLLFYAIFLVSKNAYIAFYGVAVFALASFAISVYKHKAAWRFCLPHVENIMPIFVITALFLSLIAPYLYYGAGNYWHTASEDAFDALNGKDYLLGNIKAVQDFLTYDYMNQWRANNTSMEQSFIYSHAAIQYSSIAFFSIFTGLQTSFDPWLIQAVVNFILMFVGIYLLSKERLKQSSRFSIIFAAVGASSHLYFGTFISMHEGSIIFGAVIPYLLYSMLGYQGTRERFYLYLSILFIVFVSITYPHPLIFFVIPFVMFMFVGRLKELVNLLFCRKVLLIFTIILLAALCAWAYMFVQYYVVFSESRFRSWGMSFAPQMLLIYWGLAQSYISNGQTVNSIIFSVDWLESSLFVIAAIFTVVSIYGAILASRVHGYFKWFILFWIVCFIGIRYVIADSYYFYKLLYTTQFVFLFFFMLALAKMYGGASVVLKKISIAIFTVFVVSNLTFNILSNYVVYQMEYNKNPDRFSSILEADHEMLKQAYLEIPKQNYKQVVDYYLRSKGIFYSKELKNAKYIVLMKNVETVYDELYKDAAVKVVFENSAFKIIEKPTINYLSCDGGWETETSQEAYGGFKDSPFIWMSNGFKLTLSGKTDKKYMQFCIESGPGVDFKPIDISFDGNILSDFISGCAFIDVNSSGDFMHTITSSAKGHKLLPFEERELNYRVGFVDFTDKNYSLEAYNYLNPKNDVIPQKDRDSLQNGNLRDGIILGNGWYPQELANMRWGSDSLELVVVNPSKNAVTVQMSAEPGLGCMGKPLSFKVLNESGETVSGAVLDKKKNIELVLPVMPGREYEIFKIKLDNKLQKIEADPRLLGIRIFSLKIKKDN